MENSTFWCVLGAIYARLICGKLGLNNPEKIFGGSGQDLGGLCPPGPNLEPPLEAHIILCVTMVTRSLSLTDNMEHLQFLCKRYQFVMEVPRELVPCRFDCLQVNCGCYGRVWKEQVGKFRQ